MSGGTWAFQPTANGDIIGTQPQWLLNVDQTAARRARQRDPAGRHLVGLAHLPDRDGGGAFDVEFGRSGPPVLATVSGGDWGGSLPGVSETDNAAVTGANLNLTERTTICRRRRGV